MEQQGTDAWWTLPIEKLLPKEAVAKVIFLLQIQKVLERAQWWGMISPSYIPITLFHLGPSQEGILGNKYPESEI